MRGNLVAIEGAPDARENAASLLRALYARIQNNEELGQGEVDAEIRFAGHEKLAAPQSFGTSTLRTAASRIIRARSPAQAAYLDLMRSHPLVFGIGPAGTGQDLSRRRLRRASPA